MARYLIYYSLSDNGVKGDGNCEMELSKPIQDIADAMAIAQIIRDSLPNRPSVVVQSWQRFED